MPIGVPDRQYFLDEEGEIYATIPPEAGQPASFFVFIVDEASGLKESKANQVYVRCRAEGCEA